MWLRKPSHLWSPQKKKIDTVDKTEKSRKLKEIVNTYKSNITDTINTIDKSRSTPRNNSSNKITKIEKPLEINIHWESLSVSALSGQRESLASVTPDNILFLARIKKINSRHFSYKKRTHWRYSQP